MPQVKVVFYTVKEPSFKIQAILQTIDKHLHLKEKIQIIAPDIASLNFIENLLWTYPKESFRPSSLKEPTPFQDLILICLSQDSSENYPLTFNLCKTPYKASSQTKIIYELEDLSHPEKALDFQKKFQAYQKLGFQLSSGVVA